MATPINWTDQDPVGSPEDRNGVQILTKKASTGTSTYREPGQCLKWCNGPTAEVATKQTERRY